MKRLRLHRWPPCSRAAPALADALVDNVNGYTIAPRTAACARFTGIVIGDDGRVRSCCRPRRPPAGAAALSARRPRPDPDPRPDRRPRPRHGPRPRRAPARPLATPARSPRRRRGSPPMPPPIPTPRWIVGRGWNQERWGLGRFPTAADLDAVVGDRPVWLERVDGHAGWANSVGDARGRASPPRRRAPQGGRIERDRARNADRRSSSTRRWR